MTGFLKIFGWIVFAFFAIAIGIYPLIYIEFDSSSGFLASKPVELVQSWIWQIAFYLHISFGGLSLLTGWSQFSKYLRRKTLGLHRWLGKIYLISVTISGTAGLYIAFHATGGFITITGFSALALVWTASSIQAYVSIRARNVDEHRYWMIRSYAFCWAAVTLRLWIPVLYSGFGLEYLTAYKIVAWLSWIPNALVAETVISRMKAVQGAQGSYQQ